MSQSALAQEIISVFESFKSARKPWEEIWEECWYNFLGQYQEATRWRSTEGVSNRSKVFIKLTTLKCHTAHSKIMDVHYGEVPFELVPINPEEFGVPYEEAKKIATKRIEILKGHFRDIELEEIKDTAVLEMAILGTAVLKGPIIETRMRPSVRIRTLGGLPANEIDPEINPYEMSTAQEMVPIVDHVPLWEYYVDPNAKSNRESIGEIQFKRVLPAEFMKLANQGGYNKERVNEAARRATTTDQSDLRYVQLADNWMGEQGTKDQRVSVLEYWGLVKAANLAEEGCELPPDTDKDDYIEALVVLGADGIVCKATVNPLGRRAFHVCPYKKRPHIIYGMGVAEAMRDSQKMVNSAARMLIDNKAMSGAGMVGINLDRINTKRTKDLKIYPWKTWYVKGNFAPSDAISAVEFKDVTQGLRELMEMFERFADEETGIPKYTHGQQDNFLNKTATGMSMLMTQANINLKTVMKNIDDYWIEPLVEAFDAFFSEFKYPNEIRLPMKIKARGTDSLMAKEIKLENIMRFLQVSSSPQDAIITDRAKIMKEIARLLDMTEFVQPDEMIAEIMKEMSSRSRQPVDMRETVHIDKLYPLLTRKEQIQILDELGIKPDMSIQTPMVEEKAIQ